jgi:SAM-dependent methyltransferase
VGLDADLIAYYEAEARDGRRTTQVDLRVRLRKRFAELLCHEKRNRVVDVGAGPGLDVQGFQAGGFTAVGLDLAFANAAVMQRRGLQALGGSLYQLPFRTGCFDAVWSMSTFVHVPHARYQQAISEMLRVVQPAGLLGIGTWGGSDFEGVVETGDLRPCRFFSLASHDRWRAMLAGHGDVVLFETYETDDPLGWEYQFAVLRAPA